MRRLSRIMTGVAMLAVLGGGCGSTNGAGGNDALVLQFIQWDNTGLTQADSVGESSADVDVVQDECISSGQATAEPFTQTVINAIFMNNEGADILLQGYSTKLGDPRLFQANITNGALGTNITGGRCASTNAKCAIDNDCSLGGGALGSCLHTETTVSGIVLFDFQAKAFLDAFIFGQPQHLDVLGQAIPMTVTFFASDPNHSFQISVNYTVTFGDFDNCPASTGGGAGAA